MYRRSGRGLDGAQSWEISSSKDDQLTKFFGRKGPAAPRLVIAGAGGEAGSVSRSNSHGGFDNDPDTLNAVLLRIVGGTLKRAFKTKDLQY